MDLSHRVLGKHVTDELRQRGTSTLLQIGTDTFSRFHLSHVACFNFQAALTLSRIIAKEFNVDNTRDFFENVSPQALAIPGIGSIAIAVLGAAFEAKRIGGEAPLESWVRKHLKVKDENIMTFATLKERDQKDVADEKKRAKARKHARRDEAHRTRVTRFTKRSEMMKAS